MAITAMHNCVKSVFHQMEGVVNKNPIDAVVYSLALKALIFISISFFFGYGAMSFCLITFTIMFDLALIKNCKKVYLAVKDKLFNNKPNQPEDVNPHQISTKQPEQEPNS